MQNLRNIAIIGVFAVFVACSSGEAVSTAPEPREDLADEERLPVRAFLHRGIFTIPGCRDYDRKFPAQVPVITIPTVQQAHLAGFRPISDCPAAALRLEKEVRVLGRLQPTAETDNWKTQLILYRKARSAESDAYQARQQQEELRQRVDELEVEQNNR